MYRECCSHACFNFNRLAKTTTFFRQIHALIFFVQERKKKKKIYVAWSIRISTPPTVRIHESLFLVHWVAGCVRPDRISPSKRHWWFIPGASDKSDRFWHSWFCWWPCVVCCCGWSSQCCYVWECWIGGIYTEDACVTLINWLRMMTTPDLHGNQTTIVTCILPLILELWVGGWVILVRRSIWMEGSSRLLLLGWAMMIRDLVG